MKVWLTNLSKYKISKTQREIEVAEEIIRETPDE